MATSGTTDFDLELVDIVEEAYERIGKEHRTGYEMRTARRSLNLMFADWANRGVNLWTLEQGTIPLVAGTATYDLPTDTVDLLEHVVRTGAGVATTQFDLALTRISVSTYATIPNKLMQARPLQVLVTRTAPTSQVTLWPVPDNAQTYTLVYWRLRRLEDAGDGIQTQDIPFRFLPPLVAGLAYHLAMKSPDDAVLNRLPMLKAQYDEAWLLAEGEDREKAAVRFVPRMTAY